MIKQDCEAYKRMNIWKPELCKWCAARHCQERKMNYVVGLVQEKGRVRS